MSKPDWDEYFIGMLDAVAARASCDRGRSAAILTRSNRILSTGYVGAPMGMPSCDEIGHKMIQVHEPFGPISEHCVRTFHAEMNAIIWCARDGVSAEGATLYCSMIPCDRCAMAIIQVGIVRVVAKNEYHKSQDTKDMFVDRVELTILDPTTRY